MMPGSVTADWSSSATETTEGAMVPPTGGPTGLLRCRSRQPSKGWLPVRGVRVYQHAGAPLLDLPLARRFQHSFLREPEHQAAANLLGLRHTIARLDQLEESRLFGFEPQRVHDLVWWLHDI